MSRNDRPELRLFDFAIRITSLHGSVTLAICPFGTSTDRLFWLENMAARIVYQSSYSAESVD